MGGGGWRGRPGEGQSTPTVVKNETGHVIIRKKITGKNW